MRKVFLSLSLNCQREREREMSICSVYDAEKEEALPFLLSDQKAMVIGG
jgi:hypothetical protein